MKCGIAGCCISVVLAFTIALLAGLRRSIDNSLGAPHGLFGLTWLTKGWKNRSKNWDGRYLYYPFLHSTTCEAPPLPPLTMILEDFLLSPEYLPLHNSRSSHKIWPREVNVESLYRSGPSPLHTQIAVERDPTSGELLGYHEVEVSHVGQTAKNSTSLNRAPDPLNTSIKGDSTNYPFWPGGLKEPDVLQKVDVTAFDDVLANELLTVPPGFSEGMNCELNKEELKEKLSPSQAISISELISGSDLMHWASETGELEHQTSGEEENEVKDVIGSEDLSEVLAESETDTERRAPEKQKQASKVPLASSVDSGKEWAVRVHLHENITNFRERVPNMAHTWKFELDLFQKQAIICLEDHECVFVAAHTSAGKTVVAEYAIALSLQHKTRTIYTSPIKALSNQKFREFRLTFGEEEIGLLTGDVQIKPESPCLIMTTEILRSMLYNGSEVIREVEWVIFDEVHYINDTERGVVWEEVLIMLPDHVSIIMLSATVPNCMEFADWVGRTKRKHIYVISTLKRPVPLVHYLYTGNSKQTSKELFLIVTEDGKFSSRGYQDALSAKKERATKAMASYGPKSKQFVNPKEEKNIWLSLVHMLNKKDKLPVVAFTFSRDRCSGNADSLSSLDLTTSEEKHVIHTYFQKSIQLLKGSDQSLPQVKWMREHLKRGVAVHHSGILPILKEVIELLFQKGLVRLLFATETFAMGVNMPARTVVFDAIMKHDGTRKRDLYPGEYVQMAGRAGRRGLDTNGTVIVLCKADIPEASDLHKMILGQPTTLESRFRLTYSMILNLMRVETLRVEDMMKRSFSEIDSARSEEDRKHNLETLLSRKQQLQTLDCQLCTSDIHQYYCSCAQLLSLREETQAVLLNKPQVLKVLSPGRVITIFTEKYKYNLAVVLQQNTRTAVKTFTVLILCNIEDESEQVAKHLNPFLSVEPYVPREDLFHPDSPVGHAVVDISGKLIVNISGEVIPVESSRIIEDYRRRQIPRFSDNPPSSSVSKAVQSLLRLVENHQAMTNLNPVKDLHVMDLDFVSSWKEMKELEKKMNNYSCVCCPNFKEHFENEKSKCEIQQQLSDLNFKLSESSLQFLPEYKHRVEVLKQLHFLNQKELVSLKGRVACEIHSYEVLLTELIFCNAFDDYSPEEIVALLSCMVFQQSKCSEPNLTEQLKKGKETILKVAADLVETENTCGLKTSVEEYQKEFKFGLVEVVYEWAKGKEFVDVIELTDVSEGLIVRCIQRLDELCRDVRKGAKVIGASFLGQKMVEASSCIKRDIVFAASLYTKSGM